MCISSPDMQISSPDSRLSLNLFLGTATWVRGREGEKEGGSEASALQLFSVCPHRFSLQRKEVFPGKGGEENE